VADRLHTRIRKGCGPDPIMEVLHTHAADGLPLLRRTQRLLGLAGIPQVDDPDVTLRLQLLQIQPRRLVAHRDRGRDRSLDVHVPLPALDVQGSESRMSSWRTYRILNAGRRSRKSSPAASEARPWNREANASREPRTISPRTAFRIKRP